MHDISVSEVFDAVKEQLAGDISPDRSKEDKNMEGIKQEG